MKKSVGIFFLMICLASCHETTVSYFDADITMTDISSVQTDTLLGEIVPLKDVYAGYMTTYDSLMLFVSYSFSDYFLYIFNLNSNELIAKYGKKGQGPDDYINFTHGEQFVVDEGSIKLWIRDRDRDENKLLNLTSVIRNRTDNIDSTVYLDWKKFSFMTYGAIFMAYNNSVLARIQAQRKGERDYIPDRYEIYHTEPEQKRLDTIKIFNQPIIKNQPGKSKPEFVLENYFNSSDRIKPDGSKLVMAMQMMAQINIYDIKEKRLKGFRIENTPDFEYLAKDVENYRIFFIDVRVDDDNIYALYSNVIIEGDGENYPFETNTILVYNWNGEIVRKIILDKKTSEISVDPVSRTLYALTNEDILYKYDLGL